MLHSNMNNYLWVSFWRTHGESTETSCIQSFTWRTRKIGMLEVVIFVLVYMRVHLLDSGVFILLQKYHIKLKVLASREKSHGWECMNNEISFFTFDAKYLNSLLFFLINLPLILFKLHYFALSVFVTLLYTFSLYHIFFPFLKQSKSTSFTSFFSHLNHYFK